MAEYNPWLSASQIRMFLRCARQWAFRYIEHLIIPPNGLMKRGGSVHSTIEHNYQQKRETHTDLPTTFLKDWFAQNFEDEWTREEVRPREDEPPKGELKDQGYALVEVYAKQLAPKVQPVLVEDKFDVELGKDDYGFRLSGKIDVVDSNNWIRDNKTASRTPNQNDVNLDIQLSTYSLARRMYLRKEAGDLSALSEEERQAKIKGMVEPKLTLDMLVLTKEPKLVVLETERTREGLAMHLNTIGNIAKSIRADAFPRNPTGWWCSPKWCGYWSRCMGKGIKFIDLGENLQGQLEASIEQLSHKDAAPVDPTNEREPGED